MIARSYVIGFCFDDRREMARYVLLIRKRRPAWMAGKLNGIGGKIEAGETPRNAMVREFREEAGRDVAGWASVAHIECAGECALSIWAAIDPVAFFEAQTVTDEKVEAVSLRDLARLGRIGATVGNLPWLVGMALDPFVLAHNARVRFPVDRARQ